MTKKEFAQKVKDKKYVELSGNEQKRLDQMLESLHRHKKNKIYLAFLFDEKIGEIIQKYG